MPRDSASARTPASHSTKDGRGRSGEGFDCAIAELDAPVEARTANSGITRFQTRTLECTTVQFTNDNSQFTKRRHAKREALNRAQSQTQRSLFGNSHLSIVNCQLISEPPPAPRRAAAGASSAERGGPPRRTEGRAAGTVQRKTPSTPVFGPDQRAPRRRGWWPSPDRSPMP